MMYLHFGTGAEPRLTVSVESKESPLWWHDKGLSYTATGYGNRIPSRHMVKWNGKWRRVYVCCYGNSGTAYIGKPGNWIATVSD